MIYIRNENFDNYCAFIPIRSKRHAQAKSKAVEKNHAYYKKANNKYKGEIR